MMKKSLFAQDSSTRDGAAQSTGSRTSRQEGADKLPRFDRMKAAGTIYTNLLNDGRSGSTVSFR